MSELVLLTACGLAAVAVLAAFVFPAYRRTAGWFALAAIGQGAALRMIAAGRAVHYQHYLPLDTLAAAHPWLLLVVVVQIVIVIVAIVRSGYATSGAPRFGTPAWRVVAALLLSAATAATVSSDVRRYLVELAFAGVVQILAVATIALMARSWPHAESERLGAVVGRMLGRTGPTAGRSDRMFSLIAAGTAMTLAAALNVAAYGRHPHIPDEVGYLHQAKYFSEGALTMPVPAVPAAFDVDLMTYDADRWYSPMPPGWPAVLTVGVWAGVPWLVNPVLAALNVLLAFVLLRGVYSRSVARGAAVLLAVSPWFLFLGMSFCTHQLALTGALIAAVGVMQARRAGRWPWGLIAGAGVGLTSLVRPLDGLILGALIAAWSLGLGGSRLRLGSLAGLAFGTALVGALVLPYNQTLTGHPLKFPVNAYFDKYYAAGSNDYGFGPNRGVGWAIDPNPGHTPVDGLINANLNTFGINTDLFGWFTGSLVFVTWLVCSGAWRRQDSVMAGVVIAIVSGYFPYYFSGGPDFGARYWFLVIVPLVALTVRGVETLEARLGPRVWLAVGAMVVMTVVTYLPWRGADKYHDFRGMTAELRDLAARQRFGADLILVAGQRFPDYATAFAENPADLHRDVAIYAWDRDPETRVAVLREYADRRVWLIDGPSVTGTGFRIARGPVSARALLAEGRASR